MSNPTPPLAQGGIPDFAQQLRRHFPHAPFCLCPTTGAVYMAGGGIHPKLDILKLDAWLHMRHGEYEEERGISMVELVAVEYGDAAVTWVKAHL